MRGLEIGDWRLATREGGKSKTRFVCLLSGCFQIPFQSGHGLRKVPASQADAEVVARVVVHGTGEEQYTGLLDQIIAEVFYIALEQSGKAHRARGRTNPGEE